jgi:fumarylacetoacetate (FAA) hydrolase family protein
VRADSVIDVPEPELALVLNARAEICGYTICNDVSSRTIEGENPLYLPQAKIYLGGCALGPVIRTAWEIPDPYRLTITLTITRDGAGIWAGTASTAGLHRKFGELVEHLYRGRVPGRRDPGHRHVARSRAAVQPGRRGRGLHRHRRCRRADISLVGALFPRSR